MKYYIIAGEASGDLHASNLMKALKEQDPEAQFRCWGGDKMQQAGGELVKHYRDLAFMGFLEVVMNLRTILGNLKFCKQDILQWQPDVVVLVDYPGFNLRIAKFLKQQGITCHYYISPQIWAWKEGRVEQIKRDVDHMYVILPFEEAFYDKHHYKVDFVGHPLLDALKGREPDEQLAQQLNPDDKPLVALLPGSRKQEITKMLPLLLQAVPQFPDHVFVVAGLDHIEPELYQNLIGDLPVKVVTGKTYDLLEIADAALVTSGTATLETALLNVPQVVCYKGNPISYYIARMLIKVKYIALVNLIMDRVVVTELIQNDLNVENLKSELTKLTDPNGRQQMLNDYEELSYKLGGPGASARAAELMVGYLKG